MKESQINGLTFIEKGNGGFFNSNIKVTKEEPKQLVKFYSNDRWSRDALINNYLYLSHHYQFNDSFEASPTLLDFSELNEDDYNKFIHGFNDIPLECYSSAKQKGFSNLSILINFVYNYIGSLAFTTFENIHNNLMWSHYSKDKGFTIVFERERLFELIPQQKFHSKFFPVNYVDKLYGIKPYNLGIFITILYMIATKTKEWSYENEWRLSLFNIKDSYFQVPPMLNLPNGAPGRERKFIYKNSNCIEMIILGINFFNSDNSISFDEDDNLYHIKNNDEKEDFIKLLDYICDNHNEHLYLNTVYCDGHLKRGSFKIKLEKKGNDSYKVLNLMED